MFFLISMVWAWPQPCNHYGVIGNIIQRWVIEESMLYA
jgi:hypothetical protein